MLSWADMMDNDGEVGSNSPQRKINPLFERKEKVSQSLLNFLKIDEFESDNLRLFDHKKFDDGNELFLVHYITDPPESRLEKYRGVVIEKNREKYRIVCRSFPYTHEHVVKTFTIPEFIFGTVSVVKAYEGTVLRLWWYESENESESESRWYLSTHRKIDGTRSRWCGSKTFGEMFEEVWNEDLYSKLDKKLVHIFLLCHPENRLACIYPQPVLYQVGVYDPTTDDFLDITLHRIDESIPLPEKVEVESFDQLESLVQKMDWKCETGVLLSTKENDEYRKILNEEYYNKRELRGNEPNLRMRWFQLHEQNKHEELEDLLPEKESFFSQLKKDNDEVIEYLLDLYDYRYYQSNFLRLPRENFIVLEDFDRCWQQRQEEEKLQYTEENTIKILKEVLKRYNPRIRNALIRHLNEWKKECEEPLL